MRKSLHRIIALALTFIIAVSELTVPVYASQTSDTEELEQSESASPEEYGEVYGVEKIEEESDTDIGVDESLEIEDNTSSSDDTSSPDDSSGSNTDDETFPTGYMDIPGQDTPEIVEDISDESSLLSESELESAYVTPNLPELRKQSPYGTCWAFSSIALAEINLINSGKMSEADLSELHLAYFTYNSAEDPLGGTTGDINQGIYSNQKKPENKYLDRGGNLLFSSMVLASWTGAADEHDEMGYYKYSNALSVLSNGYDSSCAFDDVAHMTGVYEVDINDDPETAKKLIKQNGALGISVYVINSMSAATSSEVYSEENNCYYDPENHSGTNHAVTVVGWDDNFSRDNFAQTPAGDGAWLIRNSWKSGGYYGDSNSMTYSGYYWLSYYDATIESTAYSFVFDTADNYDNNYQYDGGMFTGSAGGYSTMSAANIFTAKAGNYGESIKAVSFYCYSANTEYEVQIYTFSDTDDATDPEGGTLSATATGTTGCRGYYTVDDFPSIPIAEGQKYSVVVKLSKPDGYASIGCEITSSSYWYNTETSASAGQSYIKAPNSSWSDYGSRNNANLRIKAFTDNNESDIDIAPESFELKYDDMLTLENGLSLGIGEKYRIGYTVLPDNATNKTIIWSSSDEDVAGVSNKGIVTGTGIGSAIIKGTTELGGIISSFNVSVENKLTGITITPEYGRAYVEKTKTNQCTITTEPADITTSGKVEWSSDNPEIVRIDSNGVVTGVSIGTTTIRAKLDGKSASLEFTCYPMAPSPKASVDDDNVITLSWKAVKDADQYRVNLSGTTIATITADDSKTEYSYIDERYKGSSEDYVLKYTVYTYENGYGMGSSVTASIGPVYTITYEVGAGTNDPSNPSKYRKNNSIVLKPPTPPTGYYFSGWYSDKEYTTYKSSINFESGDQTFYAKYLPIKYYVKYNANGGSGYMDTTYMEYDQTYSLSANTFSRSGYTFAGWNTKADGNGVFYADKASVKNLAVTNGVTFNLYAMWDAAEYTVSLNPNGGSLQSGVPSSLKVKYGETYGEMPVPVRAGYTFNGWYTSASGGIRRNSTDTVRLTANEKLYAHWTANTYTVTYNNNGGSSTGSESMTVTFGSTYSGLTASSKMSRVGYTFEGWYTDPDSGTKITSATTVTIPEDHVLYAHWTANNYYVKYNANNGTGVMANTSMKYDVEQTLSVNTFSRAGYSFVGWNTKADGTGTSYEDKETVKNLTSVKGGSVTLYAIWNPGKYTITFEANGGNCSVESITVTYDSTYGELPTPTRTGYSFNNWWTAASGGTRITNSSKVTITGNTTLYAHWSAASYLVTFDARGGVCDTDSKIVRFDDKYGELPIPSRPGYGFEGWYTEISGGSQVSADTVVKTTSEQTLYAHWSVGKYTITFEPNGGTCDIQSKSVEYNGTYGGLPTPTRPGYDFDGWYTAQNGGNKILSDSNVEITSDQTLYAHWKAESYNLKFEPTGGECPETSRVVTYNGTYGKLPEAVRPGYSFAGWYTEKDGGDIVTADAVVTITGDQTLYARWSPNSYTLIFDANGGTVDGRSSVTGTITYGATYGVLPDAVRDGYDFVGWFTDMTGGIQITSDTVCETTEEVTLYAHWTYEHYLVTFNANGGRFEDNSDITTRSVVLFGVYGAMPTPTKAGSEFAGWYTKDLGGTCVTEDTRFSKDITTLYAHWNTFHTVTFDANNGTFGDGIEEVTARVMHGEIISDKILVRVGIPTYEDNEGKRDFGGWHTDPGTNPNTLFDIDNTEITEDITLYAGWESRYEGFRINGLDEAYYEYTGAAIKPEISVTYYDAAYGDRELTLGKDYTVSYKNNTNAAGKDAVNAKGVSVAPSVIVKGKGDYSGTITGTFTIHQRDIGEAYADLDDEVTNNLNAYHISLIYNGKDQKLAPKLKIDLPTGKTVNLSKGKDYTLSTESVKDVDNYDVIVSGKGNYTSSRILRVQVSDKTVKSISKVKIPAIPNQEYDEYLSGSGYEGYRYVLSESPSAGYKRVVDSKDNVFEWSLTDSSVKPAYTLKENIDYQLEYSDNDTVGTATVTIIGIGDNYSGSVKKTFKITGIPMSKVTIPKTFEMTTDPDAIYDPATKKFHYTGKEIVVAGPANIGENITNSADYGIELEYKTPGQTVADKLKKGIDYTVTYQKNIEPGTASVIFTGKGKFTGSVTKKFTIQGYDIGKHPGKDRGINIDITMPNEYNYVKGGVKPEPVVKFNGKELLNGTDYKLSWTNNTRLGSVGDINTKGKSIAPTVIITGKGKYTGKITKEFTITQGELNSELSATDIVYKANAAGLYTKSKISVTDSEGQLLKAGTDYSFKFEYESFNGENKGTIREKEGRSWVDKEVNAGDSVEKSHCIPVGTVIKVTVYGKGFYDGQKASGTFRFAANDFTKAKIPSIPAQIYTEEKIEADTIADIISNGVTFKVSKEQTDTLSCGVEGVEEDEKESDCLITSISNNKDVGTAKVTIKGNPAKGYAGEKTVTFKIVARSMCHTISYDPNTEGLPEGDYRIIGSMKQSLTPIGGKLSKNAFKVQVKNAAGNWVVAPAAEVSFAGWNTKADGSGTSYSDMSTFSPSWTDRLMHRSETWTLYAQWKKN